MERPLERPLTRPSAGRVFAGLMVGAVLAGGALSVPGFVAPSQAAGGSAPDASSPSTGAAPSVAASEPASPATQPSSLHLPWPPSHVEVVPAPASAPIDHAAGTHTAPSVAETAAPDTAAKAAEAPPEAPKHPPAPALATAPAAEPPPAVATAPAQTPPAATPETPATPAVTQAALSPLAEQVRQLLALPSLEGLGITKREQDAIQAFYAARQDEPVFVDAHGLTAIGRGVEARFAAAGEDGLEPADYGRAKLTASADLPALARAEIRLAASALLYARHAQAGRFDPTRISPQITPLRTFPEPNAVLTGLAAAPDASKALAAYNPPHPGYWALKGKLASTQARTSGPVPVHVPAGPTLRPGDVDARIPALRARLDLKSAVAGDRLYDQALAAAVMAYQASAGLNADGVVGAATLESLNRVESAADRRSDIIANMERWRWLPRELGSTYVMVNIPEYVVRVVQSGSTIHQTRVVVGKRENQTPLLTHDMEYVVLNPYWNIPPSIARKEMLPNLQRDPYFLARQGMEVVRNGKVVDPGTVNWAQGTSGYSFRQPPGERNALGRIKFMFPNDHSVYLHDTPSKALFANDRRAYSHGCVRVQDPLKFAEVIFNIGMPGQNWTDEKIGKMLGGAERYLNLKQRIPVHLVYFTTFVDESGRLVSRDDVYGTNAQVKELLHLDPEQKLATRATPVPR